MERLGQVINGGENKTRLLRNRQLLGPAETSGPPKTRNPAKESSEPPYLVLPVNLKEQYQPGYLPQIGQAPSNTCFSSTLVFFHPRPLLGPVAPKALSRPSPHTPPPGSSKTNWQGPPLRLLPPHTSSHRSVPCSSRRRHRRKPSCPPCRPLAPRRRQGGGVLLTSAPRSSQVIQS
ncbi:hypothetical protein BGZ61DRAFT_61898 [Ilyonectria robusta]|uniref:uncharacterized protein n=1 Tax=Ilyonectria robusta TaxID=1079257 RepID=UPI001E8CB9F6|nr:uncharacterized protein BGZ61DRAFT_61898 [Ilyonectria robusta]KAH8683435.1 hypothetical protein BGZ61DRAFT_61898 [Ilyonectria robusta]